MKPQKYPSSKMKVGLVLYRVTAFTDEEDGKTTIDVEQWVVRSIKRKRGTQTRCGFALPTAIYRQQRYVHLTHKIKGITWGKRSRLNGDFGWLKSIPTRCRESFAEGDDLPIGFYTTQLAAFKSAIALKQSEIKRYKAWEQEKGYEPGYWDDVVAESEKELRLLKARLKRYQSATAFK